MDATLRIDLEDKLKEQSEDEGEGRSCPERLLEITPSPYSQGQEIEVYAWGYNINSLRLYQGEESLGTGESVSLTDEEQDTTESIEFSGTVVEQVEYPIESITRITSQTRITKESISGALSSYAPSGAVIGMKKVGGSCIGEETEEYVLYGTVLVRYLRARYGRKWTVTLPNRNGTIYFFVKDGSDVVATFEIQIGDDISEGYRDVTLVYTDYVSGVAIEGASVTIDSGLDTEQTGTTDADGKVTFLTVATGAHYIKATKTGYLDTDADDLDNDQILVE